MKITKRGRRPDRKKNKKEETRNKKRDTIKTLEINRI